MKILVITDLYPIFESEKHTPRTIYDFVQEWKNLGHEVFVIKPNFILNSFLRGKPYYKSSIYHDVDNVNYFFPFLGKIEKKLHYQFNDKNSPDLIIAHMPSGLIFANKLIKRLNLSCPLVAGIHVSDIEVLTNPIYSIYFKSQLEEAYKRATKIAARSEVLQKKFLKLYPNFSNKVFVGYSGIDSAIIEKRTWIKDKESNIKITTCANLKKRKNIDLVIKAVGELDNVQLTIIGDGKEMNNLKRLANSLNTNNKILFTGHLTHSETIKKMKESDIFILPSTNETFGMVYLESMASGCITVGLKDEGIDGIIKNGENGYLCNLDNIKEVLYSIINSKNQNDILENSYNTILNYTKEKAAKNYLSNIL